MQTDKCAEFIKLSDGIIILVGLCYVMRYVTGSRFVHFHVMFFNKYSGLLHAFSTLQHSRGDCCLLHVGLYLFTVVICRSPIPHSLELRLIERSVFYDHC